MEVRLLNLPTFVQPEQQLFPPKYRLMGIGWLEKNRMAKLPKTQQASNKKYCFFGTPSLLRALDRVADREKNSQYLQPSTRAPHTGVDRLTDGSIVTNECNGSIPLGAIAHCSALSRWVACECFRVSSLGGIASTRVLCLCHNMYQFPAHCQGSACHARHWDLCRSRAR